MRKLIGLAVTASLAVAAAVPAAASSTRHVKIGDFFFHPRSLTISRGTKVTWSWTGGSGIAHTVTVRSGPARFSSGARSTGSYSHVFTKAGTYHLYCKIHPSTMKATIVVR
jgi:plastocyanin